MAEEMRNDEGNGQLPAFTGGHNNVNAIHLVQLKLELLHLIHKASMCDSGGTYAQTNQMQVLHERSHDSFDVTWRQMSL